MKKLLSIVIFVLFGVTSVWADSVVKITVQKTPSDGGDVWTSESPTAPSGKTTYESKSSNGIFGIGEKTTKYGYIFAKAREGYKFLGWTEGEGTTYVYTQAIPNVKLGGEWSHDENQKFERTYTAHFMKKEIMDVTFHHVIVGKGKYTATYTLDDTNPYNPTITDAEQTKVEYNDVDISTVDLKATATPGYRFLRWRILYQDGTEGYDNHADTEITFAKSGTLYCEFIDDKYAQFIIKGEANKYHKLSDAIKAAQSSTSKVIVVQESGALFKEEEDVEGIYENNTYTIPQGITLLVPGDDGYTLPNTEGLQVGDKYDKNKHGQSGKRIVFTIPDGINMIVNGNLYIYATMNFSTPGLPVSYGVLSLGENCHITVNNGARLYAYGYVIGNHNNSSVTAENGAEIYEFMQIRDWRGGSTSLAMLENSEKVFIINQYYIQNIETKLILKYGAVEYVSFGTTISLIGDVNVNAPFCVPDTKNYESGFFRIGENAQLIKYYDPDFDRQKYELYRIETNKTATATLDYIQLKLNIYTISSKDYLMPVTNNMDVLLDNVDVRITNGIAMLAGSSVTIAKGTTVDVTGALVVYDAKQNEVKWTDATLTKGKDSNGMTTTVLVQNQWYNYFGSTNSALSPTTRQHTTSMYDRKNKDLVESENNPQKKTILKEDAKIIVDGTLKGAIYTTYNGASIISNEGGKVELSNLQDNYKTYQYLQYTYKNYEFDVSSFSNKDVTKNAASPVSVPLSGSPLLLNGDESHTITQNRTTYTYYKNAPNPDSDKKGRWLSEVSEGNIVPESDGSDMFELTIPEVAQQILKFTTKTDIYSIQSITETIVDGDGFALQNPSDNGTINSDGTISIPIQYSPTKIHGTEREATVRVTFKCINKTSGEFEDKNVEIGLSAKENYLPAFKINGGETNMQFKATIGVPSAGQTIKINPENANVANVADETYKTKKYVKWTYSPLPEGSPFQIKGSDYYSGVEVVYNPISTDGIVDRVHKQEFTITATYPDDISTSKTITLVGTPTLAENLLAFIAEELEIYPDQTISPLFDKIGNMQKITFTYNDQTTSDIVEISPIIEDGDIIPSEERFTLKVKDGVDITTQQVIVIKATQNSNNQFGQGSDQIKVIITPEAQWEWSKLYFGQERTTPVTGVSSNDWTLTCQTECGAITSFEEIEGGEKNYKIVVNGDGPEDECEATFLYEQGDYSRTFTSSIYADPRILPICLADDPKPIRTFDDITIARNNVEYNDAIIFNVTESAGATWTMQLVGVPNKLQFTPTVNNTWTIYESTNVNSWGEATVTPDKILLDAEGNFTHQLKATTQYIRIVCGLGSEQGKITNLCITELDDEVNSTTSMVYLPIVQDEAWTMHISPEPIELQYVSVGHELLLDIQDKDGNSIDGIIIEGENLSGTRLPATTIDALSRVETITINNLSFDPDDSKGIIYLVIKNDKGEEKLKLPIRYYHYPQPLPIHSVDWKDENAELYNFYMVKSRSQYVSYDAITQEVIFQSSAGNQRFVTFAFKGGPKYLQFETSTEVTLDNWTSTWLIEVSDGTNNQEITIEPDITPVTSGKNSYYQVRWAIPYTSKMVTILNKQTVVAESIKNVVIDGTPDLDVVQGNHTIEHETEANFSTELKTRDVTVTPINLRSLSVVSDNPNFEVTLGDKIITNTPTTLTADDCPDALGNYEVGNIAFHVVWKGTNTVDEGELIFTDANKKVLGRIRLLGTQDYILQGNASTTGLYTGISPNKITTHPFQDIEDKYKFEYTEVDLSNTFDKDGVALFDYLIVYGETETMDNTTEITAPTTSAGSNAKTPYYIYRKVQNPNGSGKYDCYQIVYNVANANVGTKAKLTEAKEGDIQLIPHAAEGTDESTDLSMQYLKIDEEQSLSVYITGFCPYASTGYTKDEEGVWTFRGKKKAKLDVYLENCHIYSRNKTLDGHSYTGKKDPGANIFQGDYAKGSGGVLVFECNQEGDYIDKEAFDVTIHTRGRNLFKSNYGCFYEVYGMRAYQVSAPVQIRLTSDQYVEQSKTHLSFDDLWPTKLTTKIIDDVEVTSYDSIRTNGFISLQKQANNAPSIDLGNANTVVNFRGGQIELQNAENVSDKYKTNMAISHRSGIMATGGLEVQMAYGIGTDDAQGGIVNFYDGTITVIRMKITDPIEQKIYLMDPQLDADGKEVVDANGNVVRTEWTTCLRCPQNTYVYGGSICMLRACMSPTSQGGAPTDGPNGRTLGRFFYEEKYGYTYNTIDESKPTDKLDASKWLVQPKLFPTDKSLFEGLVEYYRGKYTYGIESVTPNEKGQLILWLPDGYGGVKAEEDRYLTAWKACMPEIRAVLVDNATLTVGGSIGGEVSVDNDEDVDNLLYCNLDENIYNVISEHIGEGEEAIYTYKAPIKVPDGFKMEGIEVFGDYMRHAPSYVGEPDAHRVNNEEEYNICQKVYYITSAKADVWQTFTAPFDVQNIWVVETSDEKELAKTKPIITEDGEELTKRESILYTQAKHNADFASFFGVAMALGSQQTFNEIFDDYLTWARIEDDHSGSASSYTKRGKINLIPYDGTNWNEAHFYLNHNVQNWGLTTIDENGKPKYEFTTAWEIPQRDGNVLLHKGETYSMLFPYCTGCWQKDEDGNLIDRTFWDYWTGKFIIFESTLASKDNPHKIRGSHYVAKAKPEKGEWVFTSEEVTGSSTEARVAGNATFTHMNTSRTDVFEYRAEEGAETFTRISSGEKTILPTTAFLIANPPVEPTTGMPARGVMRSGEIIYDKPDDGGNGSTSGGGHMPTVGGGNDLFITAIEGGINIAVAEPQMVKVMSSTGAVLFAGYITTATDVQLPTHGIYIVSGENEVQKVMH